MAAAIPLLALLSLAADDAPTPLLLLDAERGRLLPTRVEHSPAPLLPCSQWCSRWTCSIDECLGCGAEQGCVHRSPPPPPPPRPPPLPPWNAVRHNGGSTTAAQQSPLNIQVVGSKLYANGQRLHLKGVNWFGSETGHKVPGGLDAHSIDHYLDFLRTHRFNALRLLFNHRDVLQNTRLDRSHPAMGGFRSSAHLGSAAPERYLDVFRLVARAAAHYGILVRVCALTLP